MEEDAESAWRNTQSAECNSANSGSRPLNVLPTTPIYDNPVWESSSDPPTTFISQHGALTSSRNKHVAHGASRCGCLLPTLLMALLLMCVALQSVLMFLQVSGNVRDVRRDDTGNISQTRVPEEGPITDLTMTQSQQCDQCVRFYLQTNLTQQGHSLRCPDLWILINDKCYFLSEDKKTRYYSDKDCAERGSRLAVVKEETIRRLVTITGKEFWVGLSKYKDHGGVWTGKWTDGSMENITEGIGNCAKLGSRLTRENCYHELQWICERDTV